MTAPIAILGPQQPTSNARQVLQTLGVEGHVALINAGLRWDEAEVEDLAEQLGHPVHHLPLYHWFESVMEREPELARSYSARQERIKEFKRLYRTRLHAALGAVAELRRVEGVSPELVAEELTRALFDVRRIDEEMLRSLAHIRTQFPDVAQPWDVPGARRRHDEVAAVLRNCSAVVVAGGHVAVLRNRLFFFGFDKLLPDFLATKPVVCWSAGAMALSGRIVLFYDDPPEGVGEAEVLDTGLGLIDDVLVFPHARRRLRTDQPERMARLAMRFSPMPCIGLESGAWLERRDGRWISRGDQASAMLFTESGESGEVATA